MSDPIIRPLTSHDLDGAFALSSAAGWNQRPADWHMLLTLAPGGSFAAVKAARVVGTSIAIDYGGFAWIAMMLVDPACRGRGLGRRLLEAAIGAVPSDRPIRLDATPRGRVLYQRYGFEDEDLLTRYVADVSSLRGVLAADPDNLRLLTAEDLPTVADHDVRIFGGNRRAVLAWALDDAPQYARIVQADAGRVQYCLGRHGRVFDQIGPVVAGDDDAARALTMAALGEASGQTVGLDVFDSRRVFAAWLRASGFRVERPLVRMRRPASSRASATFAPSDDSGHPALAEYAILGPEFG